MSRRVIVVNDFDSSELKWCIVVEVLMWLLRLCMLGIGCCGVVC